MKRKKEEESQRESKRERDFHIMEPDYPSLEKIKIKIKKKSSK